MKIVNLRKSLVAGFGLIALFSSMQSFADANYHTAAGACSITERLDHELGGKFMWNGALTGNEYGQTYAACDLDLESLEFNWVNIRGYHARFGKYGKPMCKIVYSDRYGKYLGASYGYFMAYGNSTIKITKPDWANRYLSATLSCRIAPSDKLFGFTVVNFEGH
jgi:hypothetical protein